MTAQEVGFKIIIIPVIDLDHEVKQLLNIFERFDSASDWIGQWFIQHPSKLPVLEWIEKLQGFRDFTTRFQALHTNKSTLSQTSKSTDCKSNALPFQHYSSSFTLNLTSKQSFCKSHAVAAVAHLGIKLKNTANQLCWGAGKKTQTQTHWGEMQPG